MKFTDIFIRRPVLATVISLVILVLGFRSLISMPVRQFPHTESGVVNVTTLYYGANPDLVAGFITTPLENAIAQANGIDYMTSQSQSGVSTISLYLRLNYDTDKALTEINTKINSVLSQLPTGTLQPSLEVQTSESTDSMYIGFYSDAMPANMITDYLVRIVQPKLQAIPGVQTAELIGAKNIALRAWLDPQKLAAYGLTASDVSLAMARNDYLSGLGNTKGQMVQVNLVASTSLHTADEFKNLVLKQSKDAIVRLSDVAEVTLGSDDYDTAVTFDGRDGIFLGIKVAPAANELDVLKHVRDVMPEIFSQLPEGLHGSMGLDASDFVRSAIGEVVRSLVLGLIIVTLVVFGFLGSLRSAVIPTVAIPLSLIGTFAMMTLFGFTLNLLTLLALVLAIGLVVDDAIIVVENVNRHIEEGMKPVAAATLAARELGSPILAMTVVLAAVYVPVGFQGGLTGVLFLEFAFTLVGAITISAIVALTLSPMMCSRLLKPHSHASDSWQDRFIDIIDRNLEVVRRGYERLLHNSLTYIPVTAVFTLIMLVSAYFLYSSAPSELAPQEDDGLLLSAATPAADATVQQRAIYSRQVYDAFASYPEFARSFQFNEPGNMFGGMVLKPWDQRKRSGANIIASLQEQMNKIAGAHVGVFEIPSLPGARGWPVELVVTTTDSFDRLNDVVHQIYQEAMASGLFLFSDVDLKIDQPQSTVVLDRDKIADLGLTMSDIGNAMASMLGGGYVNYFDYSGRSYRVIPQVQQRFRLNADQLLNYYITPAGGTPVPLSTVAHITTKAIPESLNHFQQLNSATITAAPAPGITPGDALQTLIKIAQNHLPQGYSLDYSGVSRQYIHESSGFAVTLALSLIFIYLSLAALFESFRDPFIILMSVPMSIAGALVFVTLGIGGADVNIYTQVGLVTLMGLISKHGILIVEFANEMQRQGKSKREAIELAASIRLRPILMTTAAMVMGVIPLILASGAGAASRFDMGLVIASGLSIGTLFTLFVVPAIYMLVATDHLTRREIGEAAHAD